MSLLKKVGLWFLSMLIILIGIAYALFFLNQGVIKDEIVLNVNKRIAGRLIVDNIGLNLFANFPKVTISINGVELFEYKTDSTLPDQIPVLQLNKVNVSLNVIDLFNEKLLIENLMLDGGRIDLISHPDSSLNILNAINQNSTDTTTEESKISLSLNDFKILKVHIHHHDKIANQYLATTINSVESDFILTGDSLSGNLLLDFQLDSILNNNIRIMNHHSLYLEANFNANLDSLSFTINEGTFKFDLLAADITGYYNYADSGYIDMDITANHDDLSELASMEVFNPDYLPDIQSGSLQLNTKIQGKTIGQQPIINTVAILDSLHVHNKFGEVIQDSGFKLNFYSGTGTDKRDGMLYINDINLNFASGGYLTGELLVLDFAKPIYKANWQMEESLVDLSHIFSFPGIKEMAGTIRSQGRLRGNFDLQNKVFGNPKGMLRVQFDNCQFVFGESDYLLKDINGQLFMNEGELSVDNITFDANGNELKINSKIRNFIPYLLGTPTALTASLSVHTHSLNTSQLFAFDPKLREDINYQIDSIDLAVKGFFLSSDIDSFNLIPAGMLDIDNLTAKISGIPLVNKFKGNITVLKDNLTLNNITGYIGESPLAFTLSIDHYSDYFQTDSMVNMGISLKLESEKLVAKDFFTINQEFLLPKNYEHEELNNVAVNTIITTTNYELQKPCLLPEFDFQITGLKFQTHYSPVKFRDISIFGLVKDNNLYINSLFGKLGRSDVFINAELNNVVATKDTISRPFKSRISINSQVLDLDELIKLGEGDTDHLTTAEDSTSGNPFADNYPITDLSVNIGELNYYGVVIKNLSGILKLEDNNVIKLNQVKLQSGEYGSFAFDGVFDASSHQEAILTSSIKITNVDLSKLNVTYIQDGKEAKIGDHLRGVFNGSVEATVPISQDFNFELERLTGTINAVVMNGALVNYAPMQELGKYFKNKDLNNIYFADLINTMIFDNGKMTLPYMTINTTLGTIFLMGYLTTDEEMEFDVQVPVKLVAGAVLNSLFAAKKGDDGKQDEISTGAKGKYVTVHIYGNTDNYQFKIGKKHGSEPAEEQSQ